MGVDSFSKTSLLRCTSRRTKRCFSGSVPGAGSRTTRSRAISSVLTVPFTAARVQSRQFPCKHCIGLMVAWVDGKAFAVAEIPEDIVAKRGKIAKREKKKKEEVAKPRKVNKAALKKKIKTQLEGLDLLEKLTLDLLRTGMGNMNAKTARQIEEQANTAWECVSSGGSSGVAQLHEAVRRSGGSV